MKIALNAQKCTCRLGPQAVGDEMSQLPDGLSAIVQYRYAQRSGSKGYLEYFCVKVCARRVYAARGRFVDYARRAKMALPLEGVANWITPRRRLVLVLQRRGDWQTVIRYSKGVKVENKQQMANSLHAGIYQKCENDWTLNGRYK